MPRRKYKPGQEGYTFTKESLSWAKFHDVFCEFCNRRFTPGQKRGPRPKYCCSACRQSAYRDRKLANSGQAVKPVTDVAGLTGPETRGAE